MKKHILEDFNFDSEMTEEQIQKILEEQQNIAKWFNDTYGLNFEVKIIESDPKPHLDKSKI